MGAKGITVPIQEYRTDRFVHRGHELVYDTPGEGERLLVYTHGLLLDADLNRGIAGALARRARVRSRSAGA